MADPRIWYSAALKAAESLPQNFGTGEQMMSLLKKYGAKQSELDWLKVPDYLNRYKSRVPKQGLVDYIDENKVLPKEIILDRDIPFSVSNDDHWDDFAFWATEHGFRPPSTAVPDADRRAFIARHPEAVEGYRQAAREEYGGGDGIPKYGNYDYASYPNSGYKETLVTLPQKQLSGDNLAREYVRMAVGRNFDDLPASLQQFYRAEAEENRRISRNPVVGAPLYKSSHWDEPNVLFHLRTSLPGDLNEGRGMEDLQLQYGGKRTPFLEELQSDWGQQGRQKGFKASAEELAAAKSYLDDIDRKYSKMTMDAGLFSSDPKRAAAAQSILEQNPKYHDLGNMLEEARDKYEDMQSAYHSGVAKAPLVTNTNDWAAAGIRRWLLDAAEQDLPEIAWTTGAQQSARYSGHAPEGMSGFYDKMIPNILNKYLKPFGGKVELADRTPGAYTLMWNGKPFTLAPYASEDDARRAALAYMDADLNQPNLGPGWSILPQDYRESGPHRATLPGPLREKLRKEGIPFFAHGGMIDKYAQ